MLPAAPAFTALVGNPKPRSRTRAVVEHAAALLHQALVAGGAGLAPPRLVDLAELPAGLLVVPREQRSAAVAEAFAAVTGARLLLVGSPTFKGSYTGLLKLFVDLLPREALAGVVAVPLMTAASPAHQHAVESYLRPLLLALGATVPVGGLSVLEAQFDVLSTVLSRWSAGAAPALGGLLAGSERDRLLSRV